MGPINLPVGPGDFLDRLTILQIKSERITDPTKKAAIDLQLTAYEEIRARYFTDDDAQVRKMLAQLKTTNEALWDVEDNIRICEAQSRFDQMFIDLARNVYQLNDKRAAQKNALDARFGSAFGDIKEFSETNSDAI